MTDSIPAKLRQADIMRFLNRENQLRAHYPAMAYWCGYSAVLHIMKAGLHNSDTESYQFTTKLMDRLEKMKAEHAQNDAVIDDTVGQAFVEQFAQETFDRAERAMHADKATRTTADTYDAAATFFLVAAVWGEPDTETKGKVKYAKWNAARILRAIREGLDPNESNPKAPEAEPEAAPVRPSALDPTDPEVRMLMGNASLSRTPTVEDASDMGDMPPRAMSPTVTPAPALVSPTLSEPSMPDVPPNPVDDNALGSMRGGYFDPSETFAPSPMSQSPGPNATGPLPPPSGYKYPTMQPQYDDPPDLPPRLQTQYPPHVPTQPPSAALHSPPHVLPHYSPPRAVPPAPSPMDFQKSPIAPPPSAPAWSPPPPGGGAYSYDESDIAQAQKHAKWAISALNFEDVPTAVRELRKALDVLGAT